MTSRVSIGLRQTPLQPTSQIPSVLMMKGYPVRGRVSGSLNPPYLPGCRCRSTSPVELQSLTQRLPGGLRVYKAVSNQPLLICPISCLEPDFDCFLHLDCIYEPLSIQ